MRGDPRDYAATQPDTCETLGLDGEGPKRARFLRRLQGEIARRGVVDVLRAGIRHGPAQVTLFYGAPTPDNAKAVERFHPGKLRPDSREKGRQDQRKTASANTI